MHPAGLCKWVDNNTLFLRLPLPQQQERVSQVQPHESKKGAPAALLPVWGTPEDRYIPPESLRRADLEQVSRSWASVPAGDLPGCVYFRLTCSRACIRDACLPCRERQEQCCRVSHEAARAGAGQNFEQTLQQRAHSATATRQNGRCGRRAAPAQLSSCLLHPPALQVQLCTQWNCPCLALFPCR